MSISQPCFHGKELIGIMGVDLHMEDVVQDVTYYNQELNSYIFLITTEGKLNKWIYIVINITESLHRYCFVIMKKYWCTMYFISRIYHNASSIQSSNENSHTAHAHRYMALWKQGWICQNKKWHVKVRNVLNITKDFRKFYIHQWPNF